jgi:hypothetical protein
MSLDCRWVSVSALVCDECCGGLCEERQGSVGIVFYLVKLLK